MAHKNLLYDFYQPKLWLTRFLSLEENIRATADLFITVWENVVGFTPNDVAELLQEIAQRQQHADAVETVVWGSVQTLLEKTGERPPDEHNQAMLDPKFEIRQWLNLYTLLNSLRFFGERPLYTAVQNALNVEGLPPTAVMRECFRQLAHDTEILQQAISQRVWETYADGTRHPNPLAMALLITDKLAASALAPYQALFSRNGRPPIVPITYFSQQTTIRHVPYSNNVLLIGIGHDHILLEVTKSSGHGGYPHMAEYVVNQLLPAFELMAIPHEVGHYVYHHAHLGHSQTFASLAHSQFALNPYYAWCEEIFADIYGCIIAGPLTPLGLQSLLASTMGHAICTNDGEHPTGVIRPFILSHILHILHQLRPDTYPFAAVAENLSENWTAILRLDGYQIENHDALVETPNGRHAPIGEVLQDIEPILGYFAEQLLGYLDPAYSPWGHEPHDDLNAYDGVMAALTTAEFARHPTPSHLIAIEHHTHSNLYRLWRGWGDSGPLTIGGHTLTAQQEETLKTGSNAELQKLAADLKLNVSVKELKEYSLSTSKK